MHRYLLKTCKYYMKNPEKWSPISVHVETSVMYYFNIKDNFIVTVDNQFQFIVKKKKKHWCGRKCKLCHQFFCFPL